MTILLNIVILGSLSNEQAAELVRQAVASWQRPESSTVTFNEVGSLDQDITAENIQGFLGGFGAGPPKLLEENPIIFDSAGEIIDLLLGTGSNNSVLGFAGVRFTDSARSRFISAWAVLNGKTARPDGTFPQVITHELGHLLGLDHTQGLKENTQERLSYGQFIPLMFPFLFETGPGEPIRDDIAWISWLYPTEDFEKVTGTITGKVFRRSGMPLAGANVVAVKVTENSDGSVNESREEFVSVVSDFLIKGDGSYVIPGLLPGSYVVFIEPLLPSFTGGSGVGPFDNRFTEFPKDYFNANEMLTDLDDPTEKLVIEVGEGEVINDINLITNEIVNRLDLLKDDDEMVYVFPEGFSFPFFGKTYSQVVVNSDGNLTFGQGDGLAGVPRTEARFLSGPPRIAPLFTDMDPSQDGEVRAEAGNDSITFIWDRVPEFSDGPQAAPNQFSVTLFSNGDILFHYDAVQITPDRDQNFSEGLLAVVGISPGTLNSVTPMDLSGADSVFTIEDAPIYEVFPGTKFDLVGRDILLQAFAHQLLFPFYQGSSQTFTGFAVTNHGEGDVSITVEGRTGTGELLSFPDNPHFEGLESNSQLAKLGSEFFGVSLGADQEGWVRMRSDKPELPSFFLFGNGTTGPITKMDGSVAFTEQSRTLYFTRLFHGPSVFPTLSGPLEAQTFLSIANPNDVQITLRLRLFNPTGEQVGEVARTLQPLGRLFEALSSLFDLQSQKVFDGFVRVDVDGPGAVGFEMVELPDALLGFNASFEHQETVSHSAQLGHGSNIFTSLKLVNPTDERQTVILTAVIQEADGTIDTITWPDFTIGPNQTFQKRVNEIFDLPAFSASGVVGSIRVESSDGGIIGDVIFGHPQDARFAAALPLQTALFTRAIFSQVANGGDTFTGLAIFNPNETAAKVTIQVYDRDGRLVGETSLELKASHRISKLLEDLVPSTTDLNRGHIYVQSDQPLVAQELFGNNSLEFLSAVPPTVVE